MATNGEVSPFKYVLCICQRMMVCVYTETIAKLEQQSGSVGNYAGGEPMGASWTDKVMSIKGQQAPDTLPQDAVEGVADDEWVGFVFA